MCFLFPIFFCIPFRILNVFLSGKAVFLSWGALILSLALGNSLKFLLGRFVVCLVCKGRTSISEMFCVCTVQNKENKCTESTGRERIS